MAGAPIALGSLVFGLIPPVDFRGSGAGATAVLVSTKGTRRGRPRGLPTFAGGAGFFRGRPRPGRPVVFVFVFGAEVGGVADWETRRDLEVPLASMLDRSMLRLIMRGPDGSPRERFVWVVEGLSSRFFCFGGRPRLRLTGSGGFATSWGDIGAMDSSSEAAGDASGDTGGNGTKSCPCDNVG